jgi:hypothetical protein
MAVITVFEVRGQDPLKPSIPLPFATFGNRDYYQPDTWADHIFVVRVGDKQDVSVSVSGWKTKVVNTGYNQSNDDAGVSSSPGIYPQVRVTLDP